MKTEQPKARAVVVESPEDKLKEISTEVKSVLKKAEKIEVKTADDVISATEFLGGIKARRKRIEELRIFFVKPLNDQVKQINKMFQEQDNPLEIIESKVKRAISDFKLEEDRKARVEEERLLKIREKANEKREEKGLEAIQTPVASVERSEQTVKTDIGKSVAKKVWKYEVVDINAVPRQFLRCEVAHSKVMEAVNAGEKIIAGLRIYEDFDISVSVNK